VPLTEEDDVDRGDGADTMPMLAASGDGEERLRLAIRSVGACSRQPQSSHWRPARTGGTAFHAGSAGRSDHVMMMMRRCAGQAVLHSHQAGGEMRRPLS
jgi:hypothetical protein